MNTSKIIKGAVGGGRYTVTAPIVKEDYGLYLKIEGVELPSTYEVATTATNKASEATTAAQTAEYSEKYLAPMIADYLLGIS